MSDEEKVQKAARRLAQGLAGIARWADEAGNTSRWEQAQEDLEEGIALALQVVVEAIEDMGGPL